MCQMRFGWEHTWPGGLRRGRSKARNPVSQSGIRCARRISVNAALGDQLASLIRSAMNAADTE